MLDGKGDAGNDKHRTVISSMVKRETEGVLQIVYSLEIPVFPITNFRLFQSTKLVAQLPAFSANR